MVMFGLINALVWAAGLTAATWAPVPPVPSPPLDLVVRTRNIPGTSDAFTLEAIRRRFAALVYGRQDTLFSNSTSIDKSWTDATLFSYTYTPNSTEQFESEVSMEITCVTCYVKAAATAELAVNGTFDVGDMIKNVTGQIKEEFKNLTETTRSSIKAWAGNIVDELFDGELDSDDFSFDNFTIDKDFDIDIPPLSEVNLLFQLDHLELYMLVDTTIAAGATLSIPLYKSQTPLGLFVPNSDMEIGVFVTMDLILSVEGEIDLRTGFHLKLDDPIGFNIALFSRNVSRVIFNGGDFEFLPVTVMTANAVLKAILRVGMHAGLSIDLPAPGIVDLIDDILDIGAGMEVGVFAHLAEFTTNATGGAVAVAEDDGCALRLVEEYTLALGAAAGATVEFRDHTWGPQPNTTIPIFYTTVADACAATASSTPITSLARRQDVNANEDDDNRITTTLSTTVKYTALGCADTGRLICPVSLQTTSVRTSTRTLVTAVPPGVDPTFPPSTADAVAETIPFGKDVRKLSATTGVPVSYVPPPPPPPEETRTKGEGGGKDGFGERLEEIMEGETGGVSNKVIIAISVGAGVPMLVGLIATLIYWIRRQRYSPVPKSEPPLEYSSSYQSPLGSYQDELPLKKTPAVVVGEVRE